MGTAEGIALYRQREGGDVGRELVLDLFQVLAIRLELPGAIGILAEEPQISP